MFNEDSLSAALDALAQKHLDGDANVQLLRQHNEQIKYLCDIGFRIKMIYKTLREHGYRSTPDKLTYWLDKENIRARSYRKNKKRGS